jgi:riboflavin kinase/FMN adenylyltransferase
VRSLLVGDDFRFGARRSGDFSFLRSRSSDFKYDVEAMGSVMACGVRVSSTAIRERLEKADFSGAQQLLGRPYSISGRVVDGDKLGAKMGYPTANVQLKRSKAPLSGIFVVEVEGLPGAPWPGVASLGVRPTVKQQGALTLEVHLFDFEQHLYGRRIGVRFLKKLRDEQKFGDVESLVAQMDRDATAARAYFRTAAAAIVSGPT